LLASALALSACAQGKGWPDSSSAASQAPSIASTQAATEAATAAPTATPKSKPTPTEAATQAGSAWTTFAPDGAGFTSQFPGDPTLTEETFKTAAGDAPTSLWTYEDGSDLAYFIALAKYPKGSISKVSASSVFDGALAGMTGSSSGMSIGSQGSVTLNGHAGRKFTLTGSVGSKGEMFLVGDNLYMVYAAYSTAVTDLTDVNAFIGAFKLIV
jgi:hypothetical protein